MLTRQCMWVCFSTPIAKVLQGILQFQLRLGCCTVCEREGRKKEREKGKKAIKKGEKREKIRTSKSKFPKKMKITKQTKEVGFFVLFYLFNCWLLSSLFCLKKQKTKMKLRSELEKQLKSTMKMKMKMKIKGGGMGLPWEGGVYGHRNSRVICKAKVLRSAVPWLCNGLCVYPGVHSARALVYEKLANR